MKHFAQRLALDVYITWDYAKLGGRMENEVLLDRVQNLLLGMEERTNSRFDKIDSRLNGIDDRLDGIDGRLDGIDARLNVLDAKVDSLTREVRLNNELLEPFIRWSNQLESEVIRLAAALQDVQSRLAKLENAPNPAL